MKEQHSNRFMRFVYQGCLVSIFILSLLAGGLSIAEAKSKGPIKIIFSTHNMSFGYWAESVHSPWFAEIEKRTGGRVKIEPHYNGELAGVPDQYDAISKGIVDLGEFIPAVNVGRFPLDEISTLASYDINCWRPARVGWELHKIFPEMTEAYNDTKLLCTANIFVRARLCSKRPIRTLEDMKGLKLLTTGMWSGKRLEALGVTPVSIAPPDLYPSLKTGLIDGGDIMLPVFEDIKLGDMIKYITQVNTDTPMFAMAMNLNVYNSLPKDIQKIIEECGNWFVDHYDRVQLDAYKKQVDHIKSKYPHIEFIQVPQSELARWVEKDKPVKEALIKDYEKKGFKNVRKVVAEFNRLEKKYSAPEYAPDWAK